MIVQTSVEDYDELLGLFEQTGSEVPKWLLDKLGQRTRIESRDDLMAAARAAGVPERYVGVVPDESRNSQLAEGVSYYVHGTSGDGKTTKAAQMLEGWLAAGMGTALWVSSIGLLAEIADTYGGRGSEVEVVARYSSCGLLVIDDLGKERATAWALSKLFEIINNRYSGGTEPGRATPTIITTQYGSAELGRRLSHEGGVHETAQAIVGRIREAYRGIDCGPDDHRRGAANGLPTAPPSKQGPSIASEQLAIPAGKAGEHAATDRYQVSD
ncbi:MAG: ATP-binding protein [Atopobiaceae bacterium]|nr:ATP-binding protein [Atopobiaceae bacterium]